MVTDGIESFDSMILRTTEIQLCNTNPAIFLFDNSLKDQICVFEIRMISLDILHTTVK